MARESKNVFINCPFDNEYSELFRAAVFAIVDCGFNPRCAREADDGGEVRIEKLMRIIGDCRYGIHDLSRTELDQTTGLPRFNMPLELGIFLGAKRFGDGKNKDKNSLVLDVESYRYQIFISDIAGQDIRSHGRDTRRLIVHIRDWLNTASRRKDIPGGADIYRRFEEFYEGLPGTCETLGLDFQEISFADYHKIASVWLDNKIRGAA